MANEEKLGQYDVHLKRIEGETVDAQPAFAMAVYQASVAPGEDSTSGVGLVTGTTNYAMQSGEIDTPAGYSGLLLFWDVFTLPASGSISLFVDAKSPIAGDYYAYYQSSYLPATGSVAVMREILLYAGATDDSSLLWDLERKPVPMQWRIRTAVTGGSGSWGYGVGYQFIV